MSKEKQLSYEQWNGAFHYFGSTEKHPRKLKQCGNGIHPVGEYCANCIPWAEAPWKKNLEPEKDVIEGAKQFFCRYGYKHPTEQEAKICDGGYNEELKS
jgi:hypothetical protein